MPLGPCLVLARSPRKILVSDVAPILSQQLGMHPLDAKALLARSPYVFARDLAPEAAEGLAQALCDAGAPALALAQSACLEPPGAETATEIRQTPDGQYRATLPRGEEAIDPSCVVHAHFGIYNDVSLEKGAELADLRGIGLTRTYSSTVHKRLRPVGICDLYFFEPFCRIRLDQNQTRVAGPHPPSADGIRPTFRPFVKELLAQATNIPGNFSVELLLSGGGLMPVTYDSLAKFEACAEWLFLLASNGLECPAS